MNDTSSDTLTAALARHQIELDTDQIELLDRYCRLLWEWNEKLNLTRHTDYEKFVARDLVDSQSLEQFLDAGERVLDVGTGGGVPGIILAILRPDLQLDLCESVAKKARAVQAIVTDLNLDVVVHHAPAQELLDNNRYDTLVVSRRGGIAQIARLVPAPHRQVRPIADHQRPGLGQRAPRCARRGLLRKLELRKIYSYPLPGTDSESVVLSIRPKETN